MTSHYESKEATQHTDKAVGSRDEFLVAHINNLMFRQ